MFEEFEKEVKQFGYKGILATISYLSISLLIGTIFDNIALLGNWGYVISFVGVPWILNQMDWLSGKRLVKALMNGWFVAPIKFHLLVIFDSWLWYILLLEVLNKPLWILKKISGK